MARLVELRIRGLRTLADVTLPLGGLTVLIGDNGTGKSSLLEALRITQLLGRGNFMDSLSREHMLASAIRKDADGLKLDLRIEVGERNLSYSLSVDPISRRIVYEAIYELPAKFDLRSAAAPSSGVRALVRRGPQELTVLRAGTATQHPIGADLPMLEYFGRGSDVDAVAIIRDALEGIDIHLPFEAAAGWAARSVGRASTLREPRVIAPSHRLELFGGNLANAYQTLKNSGADRWRDTIELLQLGLGPALLDVQVPAVSGGGHVGLSLELRGLGQIPAFQLADGQLAYLAFVALVQLDPGRTLLTFDEPEHYLHPALLGRVTQLFEDASSRYPVILATHSDRLLDFLPDPAAAVRVCEVDAHYCTRLRQLDSAQLDKWMTRYRGLGEIRAAGQLRSVIASTEDSAA